MKGFGKKEVGELDIAALSMVMSQQNTMQSVGVAMLDKTLDMQEAMGSEVMELIDSAAMERSVNPAIGSVIDMLV